MAKLEDVIGRGLRSAQPTPTTGTSEGFLYYVTDEGVTERWSGSAWQDVSDAGTGVATHLSDSSDAHDASAISVADSGGFFTGTDVEAVLAEVGAVLDDGNKVVLPEGSAPSTPASGKVAIYAKSDGRVYSKDDAGTEYGPFDTAGGGGGGPLLAVDDVALDANGTDFAAMTGWTAIGTASAMAGATNDYDADTQDIAMPAQGDGYYRAYGGDGVSHYLTVHETVQVGGMLCLAFTDNSGNGSGVGLYNDNNVYTWVIASGVYSANDGVVSLVPSGTASTCSTSYVLRLSRSGSTVTTAISWDGGKSWLTDTRTDSTTFTRVAILRLWTTGGTANVLQVGRYNEV